MVGNFWMWPQLSLSSSSFNRKFEGRVCKICIYHKLEELLKEQMQEPCSAVSGNTLFSGNPLCYTDLFTCRLLVWLVEQRPCLLFSSSCPSSATGRPFCMSSQVRCAWGQYAESVQDVCLRWGICVNPCGISMGLCYLLLSSQNWIPQNRMENGGCGNGSR